MNASNKIEEGCLAVVVNSYADNTGKCVTVGRFIGHVNGYVGNNRWQVDKEVNVTTGEIVFHLREEQLMRIGDDNIKAQVTENNFDLEISV
jgi:hypothetical protein